MLKAYENSRFYNTKYLMIGGYPGVYNKANISTLYTFVNGQKKYILKDNNMLPNYALNYKWDLNDDKTKCGDNYGIVGIGYSGTRTYNRLIFYLPNKTIGGSVSYSNYTVNIDGSNITYNPVGDAQAYYNKTANNHIIFYFWPNIINNQYVQLHEQNSLFLEIYNLSSINDYSFIWGKKGVIIQKKISSKVYETYYMYYDNLSEIITLTSFNNINLTGITNAYYVADTPTGEILYNPNNRKIIYLDGHNILGIYNAIDPNLSPIPTTAGNAIIYGRYCYLLFNNVCYCTDMITETTVNYTISGYNRPMSPSISVDYYHPNCGRMIYANEGAQNYSILKVDGMNQPSNLVNPWGYMHSSGINRIKFNDNSFKYGKVTANTNDSYYRVEYLDNNDNIQIYYTNLSYAGSSLGFISSKYGCWIANRATGSGSTYDHHYWYSWDNGSTWNLII